MQAAQVERTPLILSFSHQLHDAGGRFDLGRDDGIFGAVVNDVEKGNVRRVPGHKNIYACGLLISMT